MAIYRGPGGAGDATTDSSTEAAAAINAAAQAATSATNAASSATQSANSATAASSSASSASTSASTATTKANEAAGSASAASVSALAASTSATNAAASASTATTQANNASTSATSASTSASTAQSAATLATSKATDASNAASVATTKASQASTSATNAATSETNAAASASSASTSASTATTQASNAATSATAAAASASTATTKASEASTSATNAATSATNAANSATAAATSATNSANSATSSAGSASSAAAAQIAAETARDQTLAAYDNFDDRYLGTKASDPTLDNDGNALVAGALYFNSTDGSMKVYDGSVWLAAYASLSGALLAANSLSDVASTSSARTNLGLGTAATTASTDYATAAQGTNADTAYGWGNHASAGYLLSSTAASTYQPLDADLTSIAGLSGTSGLLKKTAANTWSLDTTSYVSDTSLATTLDAYVLSDNALAYYAPQAAPTFTGNVTLSSGTANGVAYLNGSKVLTTGSNLVFDGSNLGLGVTPSAWSAYKAVQIGSGSFAALSRTAAVASNVYFDGAGWKYVESAPAALYELEDNTHTWSVFPNGSAGASASATASMTLDVSGNLGIGTSSPGQKLDVRGRTQIINSAAGTATVLNMGNDDTSGTSVVKAAFTSSGTIKASINAAVYGNDYMTFNVGSDTERMRIDYSGNLGLGVTPSAWGSPFKAFQSQNCSVAFQTNANVMRLMNNNYYNGSNYVYTSSSAASQFNLKETGAFEWQIASSGTAGNAITFTQAMTLDASGNLGIGTSSPSTKLDVVGDSLLAHQNSAGLLIRNLSGEACIDSYNSPITGNYPLRFLGSYVRFLTSDTERMRIDSSGNVGIGNTNPTYRLDISSGETTNGYAVRLRSNATAGKSRLQFTNNAVTQENAYIEGSDSNYLAFATATAERMRIDSSGNVGIGTTLSYSRLNVIGGDIGIQEEIAGRSIGFGLNNKFTSPSGVSTAYYGITWGPSESASVGLSAFNSLVFYTQATERMRIDSSGNLLVGTTSGIPGAAVSGVQIYAPSGTSGRINFGKTLSGTASAAIFYHNGTSVGSITYSNTATAYNTSSDYRLKENIQPMQNALDVVQQLNPVTYIWKADGSDGQGFIAHELQAVVPDCVTGEKDAVDEEGNPVYQGIDTSFLVATLTKAIQELKAELDATKAEVAALKGN